MAGWFNIFFVSLLGIIITGNEFTFKTFKQQLINGLSRNELWIQKLISFFILSLYSTLITIVSSLVYGSIFTPEFGFTEIFSGIQHSLLLLLQCYAYLCLGFLFVILVKSPAYSIFLFFAYWIAIEPIFRAFFSPELRQYFPMKVFGNLTKLPEVVSLSSEKELLNPDGSSALSLNQFGFENVDLSTGLNLALSVMYLAIIIFSIKFIFDKKSF
jgi:ABC-type transport system involved in multi-copper enzyme maturation permease subunit